MALRVVEPENIELPMKDYLKYLMDREVFLDLSFQSRARWLAADKKKYLYSSCHRMAPSKIVLADIDKCLELCDKDLYPLDFEYFKSLNNLGFKYIIIDGNNRNVTLLQFYGYFQYWNTDGIDSTILANTEALHYTKRSIVAGYRYSNPPRSGPSRKIYG